MDVFGVASQQDAPVAVRGRLTRHVGEPGDRSGTVDPVVGPVYGDERFAEIAQDGFACGSRVLFSHHDARRAPVRVNHLAVADLVLHPAEAMDSQGITTDDAPFRFSGYLELRDQPARRRIPSGELDARRLANPTASAVAPNEIFRAYRLALG